MGIKHSNMVPPSVHDEIANKKRQNLHSEKPSELIGYSKDYAALPKIKYPKLLLPLNALQNVGQLEWLAEFIDNEQLSSNAVTQCIERLQDYVPWFHRRYQPKKDNNKLITVRGTRIFKPKIMKKVERVDLFPSPDANRGTPYICVPKSSQIVRQTKSILNSGAHIWHKPPNYDQIPYCGTMMSGTSSGAASLGYPDSSPYISREAQRSSFPQSYQPEAFNIRSFQRNEPQLQRTLFQPDLIPQSGPSRLPLQLETNSHYQWMPSQPQKSNLSLIPRQPSSPRDYQFRPHEFTSPPAPAHSESFPSAPAYDMDGSGYGISNEITDMRQMALQGLQGPLQYNESRYSTPLQQCEQIQHTPAHITGPLTSQSIQHLSQISALQLPCGAMQQYMQPACSSSTMTPGGQATMDTILVRPRRKKAKKRTKSLPSVTRSSLGQVWPTTKPFQVIEEEIPPDRIIYEQVHVGFSSEKTVIQPPLQQFMVPTTKYMVIDVNGISQGSLGVPVCQGTSILTAEQLIKLTADSNNKQAALANRSANSRGFDDSENSQIVFCSDQVLCAGDDYQSGQNAVGSRKNNISSMYQ